MKIALALIVKASDGEAEYLNRCLASAAQYVDGVFVTITGKNERVEDVAKLFKANVSHFDWCNDFSKARNFNFAQVPPEYDYIFWVDADDVVRGLDKLRSTIQEHPSDVYSMFYLYAFDERKNPIVVHHKTRVIKNDGCVKWVGQLHEDFSESRQLTRHHINGIDVIHTSEPDHFEQAKQRNLVIAQKQVDENPDDPRSHWNLGNSLRGVERFRDSIEVFDLFLKMSQSDDEKYIARMRQAENYFSIGEKDRAIDEARYAVGIKPHYPDAFHLLGNLYYETRQFEKARDSYQMGLTMKPPYYSIVVYNPRDYDYVPLMNLAKTYFSLSLPQLAVVCLEACLKIVPEDKNLADLVETMKKESKRENEVIKTVLKLRDIKDDKKLLRKLEALPDEFKSHPRVCLLRNTRFIKQSSSGMDLVIYCGMTDAIWTPSSVKKNGIGGSEEAVLWVSKLLARRGWNVTVYNNCGHKEVFEDGVLFKPFWSWNYRDKQDVVILWRHPKPLDFDINANKIFIDLHDVIPSGEFTEKRLQKVTKIFVKTKAHRVLFPNIPDDKFVIIPNGIDPLAFAVTGKRDPYLMINTSSPDRSLTALVDLFIEVKKRVPQARLKWCYGWSVFDSSYAGNSKMMGWKDDLIKKMHSVDGIEDLGRINHEEIARLHAEANIWAYPTEFYEIHCISAVKAQAAGDIPVTTDFAALNETVNYGYKIHSDKTIEDWCKPYQVDFSLSDEKKRKEWVDRVVEVMNNPPSEQERHKMKEWALSSHNWELVVDKWEHELL